MAQDAIEAGAGRRYWNESQRSAAGKRAADSDGGYRMSGLLTEMAQSSLARLEQARAQRIRAGVVGARVRGCRRRRV